MMSTVPLSTIAKTIESWSDLAIDDLCYDGLANCWPALTSAGLTEANNPESFWDVLLMAIGLIDLQGHVQKGTCGYWLTDVGIYTYIAEWPENHLDDLIRHLDLDGSADGDEVAWYARTQYISDAMAALLAIDGNRPTLFVRLLDGMGIDLEDIRFLNQCAAYEVFSGECDRLGLPDPDPWDL